MNELTISVTQISNYIKNIFDAEETLIGVRVVGEITNLKPSSRAIYFDLKDDNASLPCVAFETTMMDDFSFGDKVVVKGKLNYYTKGGKLSFVVSKIEKYGVGELYKEYLELKDKLEKEGLFSPEHKKELPAYARKVGVVTSRTGAVIRDIIRVKNQKNHWSDLVLFPVKVQGIGAKEEIIKGIKFLDDYGVDVIIVARGGGSFEDYQPFNTEEVARTVFNAKTPIVSAIGHENDWSLIDFVADQRASTPSVASEMVFFDELRFVRNLTLPLYNYLSNLKQTSRLKCRALDNTTSTLLNLVKNKVNGNLQTLKSQTKELSNKIDQAIERNSTKLELIKASLSKNNPMEVLGRGYSKTTIKGKAITSTKDVKLGEFTETTLLNGKIVSKIMEIKEN